VPNSLGPTALRRLQILAASSATLVYGWWFTDRQPFSANALIDFLISVGVLIAVAVARRQRSAPRTPDRPTREASRFRAAVVVWSAVGAVVVGWELIAFRSLPRSAHPTISSLIESSEQYHVARLGLFAVWIALGWTLAS